MQQARYIFTFIVKYNKIKALDKIKNQLMFKKVKHIYNNNNDLI